MKKPKGYGWSVKKTTISFVYNGNDSILNCPCCGKKPTELIEMFWGSSLKSQYIRPACDCGHLIKPKDISKELCIYNGDSPEFYQEPIVIWKGVEAKNA